MNLITSHVKVHKAITTRVISEHTCNRLHVTPSTVSFNFKEGTSLLFFRFCSFLSHPQWKLRLNFYLCWHTCPCSVHFTSPCRNRHKLVSVVRFMISLNSVKNRPSLIVCTLSSQRHADLGVSSCSLLNHAHVAIVSFFFFCLHLLCHFRFPPFAPRDNSFPFQAYTQHPLAFRILRLSDVGRTVAVLNCVLQFFARFPQD